MATSYVVRIPLNLVKNAPVHISHVKESPARTSLTPDELNRLRKLGQKLGRQDGVR